MISSPHSIAQARQAIEKLIDLAPCGDNSAAEHGVRILRWLEKKERLKAEVERHNEAAPVELGLLTEAS